MTDPIGNEVSRLEYYKYYKEHYEELQRSYDERGAFIASLRNAISDLHDAASDALALIRQAKPGAFNSGVTNPSGSLDEGDVVAAKTIECIKHALVIHGDKPMHSKVHYEATARILRELFVEGSMAEQRPTLAEVAGEFADAYAKENKNFKASTFLKACGVIDADTHTMLKASGK